MPRNFPSGVITPRAHAIALPVESDMTTAWHQSVIAMLSRHN